MRICPRRREFIAWTVGRNVRMDFRWTGGDINRIRALAQELVGLQPDVILTDTTPATGALQRETRTIPIVFAGVADPVSSRGSTARVRTSPASPSWNPRWEASGLNCSRRSRPGSCDRLPRTPYGTGMRRRDFIAAASLRSKRLRPALKTAS
jgi:hypothetical protein